MSATPKDGGPVFPQPDAKWNDGNCDFVLLGSSGMTLRDWFAGQALAAVVNAASFEAHNLPCWWQKSDTHANVAKAACAIADAMLAERAKGGAA